MRTSVLSAVAKTGVTVAVAAALVLGLAMPSHAKPEPAPMAHSTALAQPDTAEKTLLAEGDGWSIYADTVLANVKPVHVTSAELARINNGSKDIVPTWVRDCGIATCSEYASRAQTKQMQRKIDLFGGGIAGLGLACGALASLAGPISTFVAYICGAGIIVYGAFFLNAVNNAADDGHCFRLRWTPPPVGGIGGPYGFYNDNSQYCKN